MTRPRRPGPPAGRNYGAKRTGGRFGWAWASSFWRVRCSRPVMVLRGSLWPRPSGQPGRSTAGHFAANGSRYAAQFAAFWACSPSRPPSSDSGPGRSYSLVPVSLPPRPGCSFGRGLGRSPALQSGGSSAGSGPRAGHLQLDSSFQPAGRGVQGWSFTSNLGLCCSGRRSPSRSSSGPGRSPFSKPRLSPSPRFR